MLEYGNIFKFVSFLVTQNRLLGCLVASACCFLPGILVYAQDGTTNASTNIPVLVLIEDEDENTVRRSSDIYKRVVAEVRRSLQFAGFRTLDEESIFADLGWTDAMPERRSRLQLVDTVKLIRQEHDAASHVRVWAAIRIHAKFLKQKPGQFARVQTRIDAELYDAQTNQFLDGDDDVEVYLAPRSCVSDRLCVSELVGEKAREIGSNLGTILAIMLERHAPPPVAGRPGSGAAMVTTYSLELHHFEPREALTIVGVMRDEFPGYMDVQNLSTEAAVRKYSYKTTASAGKLEEWLYILLEDMNFHVGREILIEIDGGFIKVEKYSYNPRRPVSDDEQKRFS